MATYGSNLTATGHEKILFGIKKVLGLPPNRSRMGVTGSGGHTTTTPRTVAILAKAGAPATNTANDAPTGKGDLCWDTTNNAIYRCSAYTNGTTFTWTQIA